MKKRSQFRAGIYLLETLTSGMYNEPLSVYREYIQNAVDSIDSCSDKKNKRVSININPELRSIIVEDNARGISSKEAQQILSGVGYSEKNHNGHLRGFRGIGRLGGIAFSDKVVFYTKMKGERSVTRQEWDCLCLRRYLENKANAQMTLKEIFDRVTIFTQYEKGKLNSSGFEVRLEGVSSFRNYITDLKRVREYISRVAPVDYNPNSFSYKEKINRYLCINVSNFSSYKILLNGKQIYKPYNDTVRITKGGVDQIDDIELLQIDIGTEPAAYGWLGKRKEMIGSIVKGDDTSGLSVRVGNILIGDSHLLDRCFREPRFNSYIIGELHIVHPELKPNSRRDDFIDNSAKNEFYNAVERNIGLPVSKEIRSRSRNRSNLDQKKSNGNIVNNMNAIFGGKELFMRNEIRYLDIARMFDRCRDCKCLKKIESEIKAYLAKEA